VSIKIMTLAWSVAVGDHTDKLVLLALADNANDQGDCYPSLTKIAEKCEVSRRTAVYSLQRLEAGGHIDRKLTAGRNTVYSVHPTSANGAPVQTVHQCKDDTSANDAPTSANGAPLPLPYKPSPSENRHKPSKGKRAKGSNPELVPDEPPPSNLNVEAWHRWVKYRKQIRKPIHPASWLGAQRKLAAFGPDQAAVVEQSIANGWQGLFPLKTEGKPKSRLGQQLAEKYPGYEF
jgi:Helix-turn-helix domain